MPAQAACVPASLLTPEAPIVTAARLALAVTVTFALLCGVAAAQPPSRPALPSFAEPAISPDSSEIAFVSGGDIWTVPAAGGTASLLVSHPSTDGHPAYSPDGKSLAFVSNRSGNGDIYVLSFESGDLRRVTHDDGYELLDGWSRDGKWLYFTTGSYDIGGSMADVYRVPADGGTPMPVVADRYANEFFSAPSPDGSIVAFSAGGYSREWWRKGHSHGDACEIWLMRDSTPPTFKQFTETGAADHWPMWRPDGQALYYVSDRDGWANLYRKTLAGDVQQLTHFRDGTLLWPKMSHDGRFIVFERNFGVWKLDTGSGQAAEVPIKLRGAPAGTAAERVDYSDRLSELALSPDGKKIAFAARGKVFAASARDGGDAVRVTHGGSAIESHASWSRDSHRLLFLSDRDGPRHVFLYDFAAGREYRLTHGPGDDTQPKFSPDETSVAFERDAKQLVTIDVSTRRERVLADNQIFDRAPFDYATAPYAWSPRGDWIAFISVGPKGFDNVYAVPTAAAATPAAVRQVTFLPNTGSNSVSWSPDGTFLLFGTGHRTEEYGLARIDLILRTPHFREDQFRDLFRDVPHPSPFRQPPPPAPAPAPTSAPTTGPSRLFPATTPAAPPAVADEGVRIVFEGIRQRLALLPVGLSVNSQSISSDGKAALMTANLGNSQNLYLFPLEDVANPVPKQLTSTPGYKSHAQFSPDLHDVYYLENGRVNVLSLESRAVRTLAVAAEVDVDFSVEKGEVFRQAWAYLNGNFVDPNFNGVNWAAVREQYAPRVAGARTPDELRRILSLMVGELNASHLGVNSPSGGRSATGRLGVTWDRASFERGGKARVAEVIPLGPAAVAGINPGDEIVAIDGKIIEADPSTHVVRSDLEAMLEQKIGRRVTLTVAPADHGLPIKSVALLATEGNTERTLAYRAWVEGRRAYVDRISNGRLGYVHLADMTEAAIARLNTDLDSQTQQREGVVVDVRNNRGGFVNGFAIDVFSRRNYLTMKQRGQVSAPSRQVLGQRALDIPTVLVVNRFTISDGEDFTEGYKSLKLGKVVGDATAGAVIFTSTVSLIDGTRFALPETAVYGNDGVPLEMHPREPDVKVIRPEGESYTDRDAQLETAVAELLKQLREAKERPTTPVPTVPPPTTRAVAREGANP